MNSNTVPANPVALKRAVKGSIDALRPCADALRGVNDPKLEKYAIAITHCYQNCKRMLAILESNSEELQAFSSFFVMSCKKCIARCREIDLDIFRRAITALEDCLGEF